MTGKTWFFIAVACLVAAVIGNVAADLGAKAAGWIAGIEAALILGTLAWIKTKKPEDKKKK